jgi:hypothetical protein
MVVLVDQEVTLVDSAVAHLVIGITGQVVAVVEDIQAAQEVTTMAVVAVVALITVGLHK